MAGKESLDNLIEGLSGAVVEAQRRIEAHQIRNFLSFFDEDSRPITKDLILPSLHPDDNGADVRYRVPLLPLVASSLLRIKEVEISFDTDLIGITEEAYGNGNGEKSLQDEEGKLPDEKVKRSIDLDIRGSGVFRKSKGTARVTIKVEGKEISEGMARLVDRLLQVQGDIR